ncbi:MAG: acetylornithine/succinylornithine family transaminase [Deltaproteobacteria bacterium]|jgi:acetylornithine/N-succinyldiaminopimelate aminotransferase|nr:acetylornithine/succinylornithine family transaminase [Deltaproteobacteria bacterium]
MRLKDTGYTFTQLKEMNKKYMIDMAERYDFVAETARGVYLYDEQGRAYLDFYGGIAVNSAGSCNEKVVAAIREQVGDIIHTSNYPYTIPQTLLAKLICETIGMDKIYFQNSGTEANEAMIKMARKYGTQTYGAERYHIITAKNSFHGRTYGSLSATGQPDNACQEGYKPVLPGFTYADFNSLESFKAACTGDTIAVMLEPVQGEGGVHVATREFMSGLRAFCDEHNLLFCLDEIQTGWGRTGAVMAYMDYGVKPDIVSMAKAMGGGMPIGAVCARSEVAKAFSAGAHGGTYSGNPVACAAALAQIHEILDLELAGQAARVGKYFLQKLATLPHAREARGKGLLIALEFDRDIAGAVKHNCLDQFLLVTSVKPNVIRMVPPLLVTEKECDAACAIIRKAVEQACK